MKNILDILAIFQNIRAQNLNGVVITTNGDFIKLSHLEGVKILI